MWESEHEYVFKFLFFKNIVFTVHQSIRIEALIVNTDLLKFFFIKVKFNVFSIFKNFVTDRAACIFNKPSINAFFMINMKAAQHSTNTIIFDGIEANNTILYKIFACLHSYKCNFNVFVQLLQKVVCYRESSALNKCLIVLSLSYAIYSLIQLILVSFLVLRHIILVLAILNI